MSDAHDPDIPSLRLATVGVDAFSESAEVRRLRAMLDATTAAVGESTARLSIRVDPVDGVVIIATLPRADDEAEFMDALAAFTFTGRDMVLIALAQLVAQTPGSDALWAEATARAERALETMRAQVAPRASVR